MASPLDNTQVIVVRLGTRPLAHFRRWLNKADTLIDLRSKCTLSVPSFKFPPSQPLLALIVEGENAIQHVAIAHRGHPHATDIEAQIKFQDGFTVQPVANLLKLRKSLQDRHARYFTDDLFNNGGVLSPTVSREITNALLAERDNLRKQVEHALQKATTSFPDATEEQRFAFQQQKDAAQIALEIAGIERKDRLRVEDDATLSRSFLDQISPRIRGLTENAILNHDARRFPFLEPLKRLHHTVASFGDERVRLDLIFAHSEMLERVTGADLIYFNVTYKAFVLVQYKALDQAGNSAYKLDSRLGAQINKMEKLRGRYPLGTAKTSQPLPPFAYRLGDEFLFVKFCERQHDLIGDDALIPGHYIPVNYFNRLSENNLLQGPRGGAAITKETLQRSLSNTDFAAVVKNAWVGSSLGQFEAIKEIIEANIADGRAMTVAVEERTS